jgi:hypothetical protein
MQLKYHSGQTIDPDLRLHMACMAIKGHYINLKRIYVLEIPIRAILYRSD